VVRASASVDTASETDVGLPSSAIGSILRPTVNPLSAE
jgi:hypothetical protein